VTPGRSVAISGTSLTISCAVPPNPAASSAAGQEVHARLAGDEDGLAVAALRLFQQLAQLTELIGASDQFRADN
jgi:hypothetical protein